MKKEKYIDLDGQELTKILSGHGNIWYENKQGRWHRLDGPAFVNYNNYQAWYKDGILHREDGPAKIYPGGQEEYYIEGKNVSKREMNLLWLKKQVRS